MKSVTSDTVADPAPVAGSVPVSPGASLPAQVRSPFRGLARVRQWDLRVPPIVVIFAIGLVLAGQLAEDLADSPPLQMLPPTVFGRRWTVVVVVLYMLVISRLVDRTVQRSLPLLERALRLDAASFKGYVQRMRPPELTVSLLLLGTSALIVTVLFAGLGLDLPLTNDPVTNQPLFLPPDPVGALAILAGYTVVGWAGLSLVYLTIRLGRALGELCRQPLEIDVFDTTNLLPFGNIALAGALAPAGIIVILLIGLGEPSTWLSWTVLLLAAIASVLALLLPLRGIHRQMSDAKDAVLASLNARISQVYAEVSRTSIGAPAMSGLNERTNTLIPLRKTVAEMTTWPFSDTVAFGRAILIASAPLIYTVLSELIKVVWINTLTT